MKKLYIVLLLISVFLSCSTLKSMGSKSQGQNAQITPDQPVENKIEQVPKWITVSKGSYEDKVIVTWKIKESFNDYLVERSKNPEGPFEKLSEVAGDTFVDSSVEQGLKAWYRVTPIENKPVPATSAPVQPTVKDTDTMKSSPAETESKGKDSGEIKSTDEKKSDEKTPVVEPVVQNLTVVVTPENVDFGYRRCPIPKGENFDSLVKQYNKPDPKYLNQEERVAAEKHQEILKGYIMNRIQLNMILVLSRPYIDGGQLIILKNFKSYTFKSSVREFIFYDAQHQYAVLLKSNRLSDIFRKYDDNILKEKLIQNGVAFCKYIGDREVVDENGIVRILPTFDTFGLATQYIKETKDWKTSTIMIVTGRKELMDEIKKVQKKVND